MSTTLDGLVPSTTYDVWIRGKNAVGPGVTSAVMQTKTKAAGKLVNSAHLNVTGTCATASGSTLLGERA